MAGAESLGNDSGPETNGAGQFFEIFTAEERILAPHSPGYPIPPERENGLIGLRLPIKEEEDVIPRGDGIGSIRVYTRVIANMLERGMSEEDAVWWSSYTDWCSLINQIKPEEVAILVPFSNGYLSSQTASNGDMQPPNLDS